MRQSRDAAQVVPRRMRGTTCAPCLLGLQRCDAFLHSLGLGPNVFQVRLAGLDLGPQLTQVSFQLGDPFCPADELPFKTQPVSAMAACALAGVVSVLAAPAGIVTVCAAVARIARVSAATAAPAAAVTAATLALTSTPAAPLTSAVAISVMPFVFTHGLYPPL